MMVREWKVLGKANHPEVEGENFCAYSAIDFAQSEQKRQRG